MGGKGKSKTSKKSKKSKSKKSSKKGSENSSKKGKKQVVEDETNTKTGEARFKFLNRDVYEGEFKITTLPNNYVCRQGPGEYRTADGQTYVGQWEGDVLKGEVKITYKDGSKYVGYVEEMKYTGTGRYEFPDNSVTTCSFVADRPVGEVVLFDPQGHEWRGLAGPTGASFIPINRFLPSGSTWTPSDFIGNNIESLMPLRGSRGSVKGAKRSSKASRGSLERGSSSRKASSVSNKSPTSSPPPSPPHSPTAKKRTPPSPPRSPPSNKKKPPSPPR